MTDKIRVMIVDDKADVRQALSNVLYFEDDITIVGTAQNGEEAVARAAELKPQVILMDIEMPLMDGLEATRLIKATQPEVTVITVSSDSRYQKRAREAGAAVFLLKPPLADHLIKEIRRNRTE